MVGQFFWHELITTDPKAAGRFYCDVVGWTTQDSGVPGHAYTLFQVGDRAVGGMLAITPDMASHGARPAWLGYVSTDDVYQTAATVRQLGGAIHIAPQEVPNVIRFTMAADPQGAVFYAAKGLVKEAPAPLPAGTPGTVGWNELMASDGQAAFAFYEKLFGWTKDQAMDMGPMGTYQLFATGAEPVGGMMTKPDAIPVPNWGYYFNVDVIDAAAERVKAAGGKVLMGPAEVPGPMYIIQCMDSLGAYFALVAPKR